MIVSDGLGLIGHQLFVVLAIEHDGLVSGFVHLLLVSTRLRSSLVRQRFVVVFSRLDIVELLFTPLLNTWLENSLLR